MPNAAPGVAAVIPCYNGAGFLPGAIESVLAQTRPVSQVVVVDDRSTDDSVAVVEAFAAAGHPVRCIQLQENGGPGTARNVAMASVGEPLVAFLDADDRWEPDHVRTLTTALAAAPDALLACSGAGRNEPAGAEALGEADGVRPRLVRSPLVPLLAVSWVGQSTVVARREALLAAGGYRDGMRHAEDYDLWLRAAVDGPFVHVVPETVRRIRHAGQASTQHTRMYRGRWGARARGLAHARARGVAFSEEQAAENLRLGYAIDLQEAWYFRDVEGIAALLAIGPEVPGAEAMRAAWARRARYLLPAWRVAGAAWDLVPPPVADAFRRLRRAARP